GTRAGPSCCSAHQGLTKRIASENLDRAISRCGSWRLVCTICPRWEKFRNLSGLSGWEFLSRSHHFPRGSSKNIGYGLRKKFFDRERVAPFFRPGRAGLVSALSCARL